MANVAKSTVSKALNNQKGLSAETKQRILEIVKENDFQPNAAAKALAQNKTGSIGLLVPHETHYSLSGAYWTQMVTIIATAASQHGYTLLIITTKEDEDISTPIKSIVQRKNVDGLLIGGEQIDNKDLQLLQNKGIPFVLLGKNPFFNHCFIDVDNFGGAAKVTQELINRGYKKIACLTGPENFLYTKERLNGFLSTIKKANLPIPRIISSHYSKEATIANAQKLITENPDADALFIAAGGDFILNVIDVLKKNNYKMKDFGLGVFDDFHIYDFLESRIIAANQPLVKIGNTAAAMLFSLIDEEKLEQTDVFLDVEVVIHNTI